MKKDILEKSRYVFLAYSALYHSIKGLIFVRNGLAYRVTRIMEDKNDRNLIINNEERVRHMAFVEIKNRYNNRIVHYCLNLNKLSDDQEKKVRVIKLKLVNSKDDTYEDSGNYEIYPKTFVCSKCGDFKQFDMRWPEDRKRWASFDSSHCEREGCDGHYEQVSILLYCERCGLVKPLSYACKEHGRKYIQLIREQKDALSTWKVVCRKCYKEHKKEPIDIMRFTCNHEDEHRHPLIKKDDENEHGKCEDVEKNASKKFKPLSIKEGGVYLPVVISMVDPPNTGNIEIDDLEFVRLGVYLGLFEDIGPLEKINGYYKIYSDPSLIKIYPNDEEIVGIIKKLKEKVQYLKDKYKDIDIESYNDYFAIKESATLDGGTIKYSEYLQKLSDSTEKKVKEKIYNTMREMFHIEEITYVPYVNLVSATIGIINGVNKFYDENFVPHFNPIWYDDSKKDAPVVYTYPYETEGIIIDFDKKKLCNWLFENRLIEINPTSYEEAKNVLLSLKKDSEPYKKLKTLLHTISHLFIREASVYTGLDSDSCSEIIFVNPGAIFIYSTSNVNIGGFQFLFEHSLYDIFDKIKNGADECPLDPVCLQERGACFSCLYLPEFVCSMFNQYLDRDTLLGEVRYSVGFWR